MKKFTSEDIKALREYLDKLEEFDHEKTSKYLTIAEWDEAIAEIEKTGEIPVKYVGRIGEWKTTTQSNGTILHSPNGTTEKAYYDIALAEQTKKYSDLLAQYAGVVNKAIYISMDDETFKKESEKVTKITDIIQLLINNPALLREAEKEAARLDINRLEPIDSMPNGEIINLLLKIINGHKNGRVVSRSNRNELITPQGKGDAIRYIRKNPSKGSTEIVEIQQADKLLKRSGKTFSKVFLFALQKMTVQGFPLEVGFSLQEMVDLGMYSSTSNAGRAVKDFFEQQKLTTLSGSIKKGKKTIKEEGGILFYHYRLENGFASFSVNEKFNMEFIASYFTVFPRFAYALSENGFSLVRYIFFRARQSTKQIKEKGSFLIGLDSIRENMGLPAPEEVKNRKYRQFIIDPIESAIEETEQALQTVPEAKEYGLTITLRGTETSKINEWLQGSLEIGLNGDFANTFTRIAIKTEEKIKAWEKARLVEAAKAEVKSAQQEAKKAPKKD